MPSDKVLKFLEKNAGLLNTEKFDDFFDNAYDDLSEKDYDILIYLVRKAEINPLSKVKKFPARYFGYDFDLISYKIPKNIEVISKYAFIGCENLEKIIIPTSVKHILSSAFYGCASLEEIIYEGTREELNWIEINEYGNNRLLAAEVQCSNGKVKYNKWSKLWGTIRQLNSCNCKKDNDFT